MQSLNISRLTRFPDSPNLVQPSLLDHKWTNFTPLSTSGIIHYLLSDHLPIFLNKTLTIDPSTKHRITHRIFDRFNYDLFASSLPTIDWNTLLNSDDINTNIRRFASSVNKIHDAYFSLVTEFIQTKRLNNPWKTSAILNSIKCKSKLFKKYKERVVPHNICKQNRNYFTHLVCIAKRNYYMNIFNNLKYTT